MSSRSCPLTRRPTQGRRLAAGPARLLRPRIHALRPGAAQLAERLTDRLAASGLAASSVNLTFTPDEAGLSAALPVPALPRAHAGGECGVGPALRVRRWLLAAGGW
ncbi:uncharacterized protein LOC117094733 [Trachypithecus francoisi]|uniref:uncharacterized protein LOC117094733 n=1 Tax=Trachypithecus francoisi TaxID=54180 RepID=UPI00141A8D07|nr:uncharacterized protein LOC117094733 [Trachypithecus francoisi]